MSHIIQISFMNQGLAFSFSGACLFILSIGLASFERFGMIWSLEFTARWLGQIFEVSTLTLSVALACLQRLQV